MAAAASPSRYLCTTRLVLPTVVLPGLETHLDAVANIVSPTPSASLPGRTSSGAIVRPGGRRGPQHALSIIRGRRVLCRLTIRNHHPLRSVRVRAIHAVSLDWSLEWTSSGAATALATVPIRPGECRIATFWAAETPSAVSAGTAGVRAAHPRVFTAPPHTFSASYLPAASGPLLAWWARHQVLTAVMAQPDPTCVAVSQLNANRDIYQAVTVPKTLHLLWQTWQASAVSPRSDSAPDLSALQAVTGAQVPLHLSPAHCAALERTLVAAAPRDRTHVRTAYDSGKRDSDATSAAVPETGDGLTAAAGSDGRGGHRQGVNRSRSAPRAAAKPVKQERVPACVVAGTPAAAAASSSGIAPATLDSWIGTGEVFRFREAIDVQWQPSHHSAAFDLFVVAGYDDPVRDSADSGDEADGLGADDDRDGAGKGASEPTGCWERLFGSDPGPFVSVVPDAGHAAPAPHSSVRSGPGFGL